MALPMSLSLETLSILRASASIFCFNSAFSSPISNSAIRASNSAAGGFVFTW